MRKYSILRRAFATACGFIMFTFCALPVAARAGSSADTAPNAFGTPLTILEANGFDYIADSTTGLTDKAYSDDALQRLVDEYGRLIWKGMPYDEYKAAMNIAWTDRTVYESNPKTVKVDITKSYKFDDIVKIMEELSKYEGVYLYDIGDSLEGRDIYLLEVNVASDRPKETVMLTGTVHAREQAGTEYILKEIADLLSSGTKEAREVLATTRFLTVPCVNPDGREGVAFDTAHFRYSNGLLWKAAANGTDLNKNFPGVSCGEILKKNKVSKYLSTSDKSIYYPGEYAGCNPETCALMKFVYYGVAVAKAKILVDYHQQGRISYAGKPWQTKAQEQRCIDLSKTIMKKLSVGNSHNYLYWPEDDGYGLNGGGSTLTDFACSVATGAKYSPGYGFYVYTDGKKEYPLIMFEDLDKARFNVKEVNSEFATMTFEIGWGSETLGYSSNARKLLDKEYTKYHFDRVLYMLSEYAHQ